MRRYTLLILTVLLSWAVISCAGAPPPAESPPPVEPAAPEQDPNLGPPDQGALNALESAKARAEAARTRALDFEGPGYAEPDWQAAESQYALAGEEEKTGSLGETKDSTDRYNTVADAFDHVFDLALPLSAQARENEVTAAWDGAIAAGIGEIYPERLQAAEDVVEQALTQYEAKDYYPAAASAFLAVELFNTLKTGAGAYQAREEIDTRGFIKYDPDNYALAEESGGLALTAYDALSAEDAKSAAEEALLRYNLVLAKGWESYASERRTLAATERQAALDLKANVAVKDDFDAAAGIYNQAETAFRAQRYSEAVDFYFQSEYMFAVICGTAAEKRRIAEDAIKRAEDRAAASEETARNAESFLGGGEG
jgi:HEPN domain-containing protein